MATIVKVIIVIVNVAWLAGLAVLLLSDPIVSVMEPTYRLVVDARRLDTRPSVMLAFL